MQEFNHIEALWASHTVDTHISAEDMLRQAKKEVSSMRTKSILNIVIMTLSMIAVTSLWFYDFQFWTTHAGISIVILAIAVYTLILYNHYRIIAGYDFTANPQQFISQLKIYQIKRHNLYKKLYWFYAIALSLGMALYFFEPLAHMPLIYRILIVIISFGWMIFCSFYVRKVVIRKDREGIALLIEKFERIYQQLH